MVPTGSAAVEAPQAQSSTRTAQYAGAVPIYAGAVPIYAGAVPIYAGAVPIYAGAVPICAPANATDAQCNAVSPGTIVVWPAGTPPNKLPGLHPDQLQTAYNLQSALGGTGQTIGIITAGGAPRTVLDLAVYRATFGLPPCADGGCFRRVDGNGGQRYPESSEQWAIEAAIDTQVASAICPNCKLLLVEAKSTRVRDVMTAIDTAVDLGATVISNSYVYSDDVDTSRRDTADSGGDSWSSRGSALPRGQALKFKSPGVPFVAGTGDVGPGATWPSSAEFAIAVGGTSLKLDSGNHRVSETAWQGSGGGCTTFVPKPAWQTATACAHRATADVSAFADPNPGASVFVSSLTKYPGWWAFGGTSVATPIVAGAIALAGNASQLTTGAFIYGHSSGLFPVSGPAYATGLGSPNGIAAF